MIQEKTHFEEIEEYDFDGLVDMLVEFEHQYGRSSLEIFFHYVHGTQVLDNDMERWLELFILYLGTDEVRKFSCP